MVGLKGVIIEVEVDYTNGLPGITIVGLPDTAVQESRERVQTAVENAGLHFLRHRIVVNLSPASICKGGLHTISPLTSSAMPICVSEDMAILQVAG